MLKKILYSAIIFIASLFLIFWFKPLELGSFLSSTLLKLNKVQRHYVDDVEYFEKNHCLNQEDCQCTLLVHGLGDRAYTWNKVLTRPSKIWKKPIHFFAINLPGSGETKQLKNEVDYHVEKQAQWLGSFLKKNINCTNWIVIGNSFGGWISSYLYLNQYAKIKALILENSAGLNLPFDHFINNYIKPSKEGSRRAHNLAYHKPFTFHDGLYEALANRLKRLPVKETLEQIELAPPYLENRLSEISIPTLVIWGKEDQLFHHSAADKFNELIAGSTIEKIEKCSHLPHKECSDEFIVAFNRFLEALK